MFTVCTHCHTRFRMTAAQLKAAGGQVRCGKCDQVFDAYEALDEGAKKTRSKLAADTPNPLQPAPDNTPELAVKVGSQTTPDLDVTLAAESEQRKLRTPLQDAGAVLSAEQKAWTPSMSAINPEVPPIEDLFAGLPDGPAEKPLPPPLTPEPQPLPFTAAPVEAPPEISFVPVEDLPAPPPPKPRRPAHTAAWWSSIAVLSLLFAIQLLHADREALGQNLVIGPSLHALYAALGEPLPPAESVSDWDVSGVNVTTDPGTPGALSITGSLTNQASYTQPWPLLRVVLTDRYGETLRARDFKPDEYLPGTQANVRLAAGLASRFRLDIVDPGADAVGFTLTPCLDLAAGRVCAVPERD